MVKAANEGGRNAADKQFEKLAQKDSSFREFLGKLGAEEKKSLRECLIKEAALAAMPDSLRETEIIKNCFGPPPIPSP